MRSDIISGDTPDTALKKEINAGDLIISYLEQIGVEYVFGIPGGAIEPLYNALARSERRGSIKPIVARHETGAAFMADGYSRNSGKLGVCCATTGPGATNLITGVASAHKNQVPMLVITAQTAMSLFGKRPFQESDDTGVNIVGMFQFCTLYNTMVSHPAQLEQKLITAIVTAMTPPYGPVHLSIPIDVLSKALPPKPQYDLRKLLHKPELLDEGSISELCEQLRGSANVVFVIGAGAAEAVPSIVELSGIIGAKIVTTPDGKGLISPYHPLYNGVIGFAGHSSAENLLADSKVDTIVATGTLFGEWNCNSWDVNLLNNRLIHIDETEANLTRTPMAKQHVLGSIASIFEATLKYFHSHPDYIGEQPESLKLASVPVRREGMGLLSQDELDDTAPIKPQWLMHRLAELFPPKTKYLIDISNGAAWAIHYLHPFDRRISERRRADRKGQGRRHQKPGIFQCAIEFGAMGWAIGNSIGAAFASPGDPVVCITGDGCMLMSGQEITVARQHNLTVIFLVLNDGALGMVKHGQMLRKAEQVGYELPEVNFAELARAMGVQSYRITKADDLLALDISSICAAKGPTLLDVVIDPDEVPPIRSRIEVLDSL